MRFNETVQSLNSPAKMSQGINQWVVPPGTQHHTPFLEAVLAQTLGCLAKLAGAAVVVAIVEMQSSGADGRQGGLPHRDYIIDALA